MLYFRQLMPNLRQASITSSVFPVPEGPVSRRLSWLWMKVIAISQRPESTANPSFPTVGAAHSSSVRILSRRVFLVAMVKRSSSGSGSCASMLLPLAVLYASHSESICASGCSSSPGTPIGVIPPMAAMKGASPSPLARLRLCLISSEGVQNTVPMGHLALTFESACMLRSVGISVPSGNFCPGSALSLFDPPSGMVFRKM